MFDEDNTFSEQNNIEAPEFVEAEALEPTEITEKQSPVATEDNSTLPAVQKHTQIAPTGEPEQFDIGGIIESHAFSIASEAATQISKPEKVKHHADSLAKTVDAQIANAIEAKNVQNQIKAAQNLIDKKELKNRLYQVEQEGKRIRKEEQHKNELQKARHKQEDYEQFWATYENTLSAYEMKKGSNRFFCRIILALDGIKGFFNGIGKVSTAIIKALKFIFIGGAIFGILYAIPTTRAWLQALLGLS